jgi:hypothetical protein
VLHEVVDIDALLAAADQHLQLGLVEHADPPRLDELEKAPQESSSSAVHLTVEPEVRQAVDVLDHVVGLDRDVATAGLQLELALASSRAAGR